MTGPVYFPEQPAFFGRHSAGPALTVLAIGFVCSRSIRIGVSIGVAEVMITGLFRSAFPQLSHTLADPRYPVMNSPYEQFSQNNTRFTTLIGPLMEELVFRGLLQPITTHIILQLIPSTQSVVLSNVRRADVISIICTATIFGGAHLGNRHRLRRVQAINATIGGLCSGLALHYFGLPAAIASHIAHNTYLTVT